jgi:hypothetical protein
MRSDRVQFVLASAAQSTMEEWRRALGDRPGLEFRVGRGPAVSYDCDAQIVKFTHAHDRYGGTPEIGRAQVLANTRNDGTPAIIVATPPFAAGPEVTDPDELADRQWFTFSQCFQAIDAWNTANPGAVTKVLIHIEGLGLEEAGREPSITGLRRALDE